MPNPARSLRSASSAMASFSVPAFCIWEYLCIVYVLVFVFLIVINWLVDFPFIAQFWAIF